jgi:hypothetical protein
MRCRSSVGCPLQASLPMCRSRMKSVFTVAFALCTACGLEATSLNARDPDLTYGSIRMALDRRVYVQYDREPGITYTSSPDRPGYQSYIDLAEGIEPGQSRRLATPGPSYETNSEGAYVLHVWARGQGSYGEPATRVVERSEPEFRCYHQTLQAQPASGDHVMTLAKARRIDRCLARLGSWQRLAD